MVQLQSTKLIQGGKPLQVKARGLKGAANPYELVYTEGDMQYAFKPDQGKLTAPAGSPSPNNFTLAEGQTYTFTPTYAIYFGIDMKGKAGQISKKDADAFAVSQTAKKLDSAADAALKTEQVKTVNIKRRALAVAGIVTLISLIAGGFYLATRKKATA